MRAKEFTNKLKEGWGAEPAAARHREQMAATAKVLQKYKNDPVKSKIANYLFVNNWSGPAIEKELAQSDVQAKYQNNMDRYEREVGPIKDWSDSMAADYLNDQNLDEEKDACYHKVKSRYKVWPSAYASGALSKCRKVGAKNWGNKSKK